MQVSDEIIKVLDYLCEKVGIAVDWTNSNILPYIEQLCTKFVKWELATSIAWLVIGIILAIVGCCFIKPAIRRWQTYRLNDIIEDNAYISIVYWVIAAVLIFIGIMVISEQIFDIITCCTFPEKVIYDYIQEINNKHGGK